jgi:hypothetical protein
MWQGRPITERNFFDLDDEPHGWCRVSTQELDAVLADPRVWRGRRATVAGGGLPSGLAALDAALPEGGFPAGALTEVHSALTGIGELSLLLPTLVASTHPTGCVARSRHGLVALIAPPYIPDAPACAAAGLDLARLLVVRAASARECCWAMEQTLRDGACSAVVAWLDPQRVSFAALRRLQLAAETGRSFGVVFRAWAERSSASPAALRLALHPFGCAEAASIGRAGLRIAVLKCRGRAGRFAIDVPSRPQGRDVSSHPAARTRSR